MYCSFAASAPQLLKSRQTTFRRFERWVTAAFLLDQVILNASDRFGGLEDFEPWRVALAEKRAIAPIFARARAPFLAVDGGDATRIGVYPGDRVGAGVHAGSHVELQRHVFRRVGGEHIHRARTLYRDEVRLVVMEARAHLQRFELLRGLSQPLGDALPGVEPLHAAPGARHHDVLGAQNLVELYGLLNAFGSEGVRAVVSGQAADFQIV